MMAVVDNKMCQFVPAGYLLSERLVLVAAAVGDHADGWIVPIKMDESELGAEAI
jgi:hypothetical protein